MIDNFTRLRSISLRGFQLEMSWQSLVVNSMKVIVSNIFTAFLVFLLFKKSSPMTLQFTGNSVLLSCVLTGSIFVYGPLHHFNFNCSCVLRSLRFAIITRRHLRARLLNETSSYPPLRVRILNKFFLAIHTVRAEFNDAFSGFGLLVKKETNLILFHIIKGHNSYLDPETSHTL